MEEKDIIIKNDNFNVLIVDDRKENLLALENLLSDQPCNIITATSGQDALALLLDHDIFLILLDVQMPDMDGFETAELIRKSRRTKNIPIIFITAIGRDQDFIFKGYKSGAVDYLLKPINPTILKKKIQIFYELHQQKIKLDEKNSELKRMFYIASHDLRSPLINIQGFNKELLACFKQITTILQETNLPRETWDKLTPLLDNEIPRDVEYIISSIKAMDTLLKGLLKISRIGEVLINKQTLDINQLVEQISANMQFQLQEKEIQLRVSELPPCIGDGSLIHQVFTNLIGNAIKYNDKPGGKYIEISGNTSDHHTIYRIRDNGNGIPPQDQNKVFDLFHRVNPGGTIEGEGVGLTAVKLIVERHNGKIWFDSVPGEGTTFYLAFPAYDES